MNTALLIIDVQNALCSGEEECFDSQRIIRTISDLGARARALGRTVILIQHEELEGALTHGAVGWQLADGLSTAVDDLRVRKTTPDAFYQTDLQPLLQARGIDRLVICGLQTDCCVNATVRQAHALGYDVVPGGRRPLHRGQWQHGGRADHRQPQQSAGSAEQCGVAD